MKAFHGDPKIKEKYIERVKSHQELDEIVQGRYWENGKGCAVGCTIEGNDHRKYETELGIPQAIARLEDRIFENLTNEEAMQFPLQFLQAINIGANLNLVIPKFLVWLLTDPQYGVYQYANQQTKHIITKIALLYEKVIEGNIVDIIEWIAIADEARGNANAADAVAKAANTALAKAANAANAEAAKAANAAAYAAYAANAATTTAVAAAANAATTTAVAAAAYAVDANAANAAVANAAEYEAARDAAVSAQKYKLLEILRLSI